MKTTTITQKEAIKQGYTFCGVHANEWQCLTPIEDLEPIDFERGNLFLAEKKGTAFAFGKDQISELLADVISDNESDDSGRDDSEIYDGIKAIDFTETENKINEVLEKHLRYKLTDILIKL